MHALCDDMESQILGGNRVNYLQQHPVAFRRSCCCQVPANRESINPDENCFFKCIGPSITKTGDKYLYYFCFFFDGRLLRIGVFRKKKQTDKSRGEGDSPNVYLMSLLKKDIPIYIFIKYECQWRSLHSVKFPLVLWPPLINSDEKLFLS